MAQYQILTQEDGSEAGQHPLADRTIKTCRDLAELRVRAAHNSEQTRWEVAKEWGFEEWIEEEKTVEDEDGNQQVMATMKQPDLFRFEFAWKAAKVLFPTAPIESNKEYVDGEVLKEARDDFLSRTEMKQNGLSELLTSMASSQAKTEDQ